MWVPDVGEGWVAATVATDDGGSHVHVALEPYNTPQSHGRATVFPRNPDIFAGIADLADLSYLNEPSVLHNLRTRFDEQRAIYTYCGIVLVAINPYDRLPLFVPLLSFQFFFFL